MITENKVQILQNTKFPICAYQVSGFFGNKSSGKTTLINKITQEFIDQADKTIYDLENPLINNGPISHYFYVSPSIISDNTLKKTQINNKLFRQDIELNDINIDKVCEHIYQMRADITPILELQFQLRQYMKNVFIQQALDELIKNRMLIHRFPQINILIKTLQQIEKLKLKYPELKTPETNMIIKNNIYKLYKLFGSTFDGYLLRVQKIILNFDDSTCSTKFVNFQNSPILRLITQARHLYIWSLNIVMHSLSATYGIFKDQFNVIVLHKGISKDAQLENIFEILNLETSKFKKEDFIQMYKQHVGSNIDDYEAREKFRYNFLLIWKDPICSIYKNLDEKIK